MNSMPNDSAQDPAASNTTTPHDAGRASEDFKIELRGGSMSETLNGWVHQMQIDKMVPLSQEHSTAPLQDAGVDSMEDVNQEELDMILSFLRLRSRKLLEELDDDAIEARIIRTDQLAKRRLMFTPDLEADSEEEENRIVRGDAYREEADLIVRQELCKQVANFAKVSNFSSRKTVSWLKKRIGVHTKKGSKSRNQGTKPRDAGDERDHISKDDASPLQKKRRLTRGMARHTRVRRREERLSTTESSDLQSLLSAAQEFIADEPLVPNDPLDTQEDGRQGDRCVIQVVDTAFVKRSDELEPSFVNHSHEDLYLAIAKNPALDLSGFVRVSRWLSNSRNADVEVNRMLEIKVTSIIVGGNNLEPIMRFIMKVCACCEFLIFIASI